MARKVKFDFKPLQGLRFKDQKKKKQILDEIAKFVKKKVLSSVARSTSPVTGDRFERLSDEYAKKKAAQRKGRSANLRLTSKMLDSMTVKVMSDNSTIRHTISDNQQDKADGHNNFSGKSKLPERPFVPDAKQDETYSEGIMRGIRKIVREKKDA